MISSTQSNQPFATNVLKEGMACDYVEAGVKKLREGGLRITQSRIQLLTILGRSSEPMSVEELHSGIGCDRCDMVTIYRSMMVFEDHGLVQRSYRYNGTTLFERRLDMPPRYRVFCKETKRFDELDDNLTGQVRVAIAALENTLRSQGYSSVSHLFEFFATNKGVREEACPAVPPPAIHASRDLRFEI